MKIVKSMRVGRFLAAAVVCLCLADTSTQAAVILYDFNSTTTAIDTTNKTAPVSTNTFTDGVTGSTYAFNITSGTGRDTAIKDGQTKAEPGSGNQTHVFSINIPDLGGSKTVSLTNLSFIFDTTKYDQTAPFTSSPAGWSLALSSGTPAITSGAPTTKAMTPYNIALSGLTGLNNTSVTFTITDTSGGNNNNLNSFYTGFDDVQVTGDVAVVPESGSLALFCLGGLALVVRRRK
jgi:hypothetical protein